MKNALNILRQCGIQPTPQRLAVVECVMTNKSHPTADELFALARKKCPTVSLATVYNTLNLLVEKRLIATQTIKEGAVVFDPNIREHHHFIDNDTGEIHDIPFDQLEVKGKEKLKQFEISEFQVILRGKKKKR